MSSFDSHAGIRHLIDNTICYLTWHEQVCATLGFEGVSQIWKDEPAWYFWLRELPGAILLRYHDDEPVGRHQYVSLAVHYFPSAGEQEYDQLSEPEKALLGDTTFFDPQTNTPQFEAYEENVSRFVVAEIGLLLNQDSEVLILICSGAQAENNPGMIFFDFLLRAWSFYSKRQHVTVKQYITPEMQSLFLVYEAAAYHEFLNAYELNGNDLSEFPDSEAQRRWTQATQLDVSCSVSGTCSCH